MFVFSFSALVVFSSYPPFSLWTTIFSIYHMLLETTDDENQDQNANQDIIKKIEML